MITRTLITNKSTTIFILVLFIYHLTVQSLFGMPVLTDMPGVEIKGTAKWHLLRQDGGFQWSGDYEFIVQMASNGWGIKLVPTVSEQGPVEMAGSDNIDTYRTMDNNYLANGSNIKQFATVCNGIFPSDGSKELQVLWLTFLYPAYHTNIMFSRPITLSDINYQITEGGEMNIEASQDSHSLKNMAFFSDGAFFYNNKTVRLDSPLNKGYKLWDISVLDVVRIGDASVPSKILYTQYLPVANNRIFNNWSADFSVESVKNLKITSPEEFLPVVTNKSLMALDYRFYSGGQPVVLIRPNQSAIDLVQYNLSHGQWLNRDQASALAGHKAVGVFSTGHDISEKRKLVVWGILTFTTIGFFLILWKNKQQNKQQK